MSKTKYKKQNKMNNKTKVGLTVHSKTPLVRNSDIIKYKTQKPCNENLKCTDLLHTHTSYSLKDVQSQLP